MARPNMLLLVFLETVATQRAQLDASSLPPRRQAVISEAKKAARRISQPHRSAAVHEGAQWLLSGDGVLVMLNDDQQAWNIIWVGQPEAAMLQIGFSAEVDGKNLVAKPPAAEATRFTDRLGAGTQITQSWGDDVQVQRRICVFDESPAVTISGRVTNGSHQDVTLGTTRILDLSPETDGWWHLADVNASPAAVFIAGTSQLMCEPGSTDRTAERSYSSTGILAFADIQHRAGLAFGFLTAQEARPDLAARFRCTQGGTFLRAESRFLGRISPAQ